MNELIANILKTKIESLSFVDKIAGLVKPVIITMQNGEGILRKTFPISSDITYNQCIENKRYQDLIPNSKYRSIIYFEDNGTSFNYLSKGWIGFNSKLLLIGWFNLSKLKECNITTNSNEFILYIISSFPRVPFNSDPFLGINIIPTTEPIKNNSIFSKYSYDENFTQYLLYPYDYFAINIDITYKANLDCLTDISLSTCTCEH
jgi:hypothetical protein